MKVSLKSLVSFGILSISFINTSFAQQKEPQTPLIWNALYQNDNNQIINPTIPSVRTSEDGRIGVKSITPGQIEFVLHKPEALNGQFLDQAGGYPITSSLSSPSTLSETSFLNEVREFNDTTFQVGFAGICDPTDVDNPGVTGAKYNPYPCEGDTTKDCYDLEVYTAFEEKKAGYYETGLLQVPVTVQVTNPKRSNAYISSVTKRSTAIRGPAWPGAKLMFEPIIAGRDKRLLVGRVGSGNFSWVNLADGRPESGIYNIVYSRMDSNVQGACNVTGFSKLYPIAYAPYDPLLKDENGNSKYGFAAHPFRDTKGNIIPKNVDMGTTYPWIDKKANNLVMMGVRSRLYNMKDGQNATTRYETRCLNGDCQGTEPGNDYNKLLLLEAQGIVSGYLLLGLWTNGKMVYMDTTIQGSDYSLDTQKKNHREVRLYKNGGTYTWVRVGSGRNVLQNTTQILRNTNIFESVENLFNHLPNMKPRSPRDVIWYISSGVRTDEFAFDDYIDPHILIYSPMNAAVEWFKEGNLPEGRNLLHKDGFSDTTHTFNHNIQIQNAATSTSWAVPSHGYMTGTNASWARNEPISQGGVKGKGLYTWWNQGVGYFIPNDTKNNNLVNLSYVASFFLDPRFNNDTTFREVLKFPNGSRILMQGRSLIRFITSSGSYSRDISLGANSLSANKWHHLAFDIRLFSSGQSLRVNVDGMEAGRAWWPSSQGKHFALQKNGTLTFAEGLHGWVDDFRVTTGSLNQEEICNLAHGSLLGLASNYSGGLSSVANKYPTVTHQDIYNQVSGTNSEVDPSTKYVCNKDYSSHKGVDVNAVIADTIPVRQDFLFPEGPLVTNTPRPNSSANNFCLKCHTSGGAGGLNISEALGPETYVLENDLRRTPMEAPRRFFGVIPANYFHNTTEWAVGPWGISPDISLHP